jgi:HK97 gp10 family phage protein
MTAIINRRQFSVGMKRRVAAGNIKIGKALNKAGLLVRNEAVNSIMANARSGGTVRRRGIEINISAVGDPPASDTGFLASQITSSVVIGHKEGTATVTSAAPYSAALEFGTIRMGARPFMQPALDKNARKIRDLFRGIF